MVKEFGIWVHTGSLPAGSEMPDLAEKIREARLNELIKFAMKIVKSGAAAPIRPAT